MNTSFQTASEQSPGRFGNAQSLLGHLDANVISNLITTTADVVLVMDENGFIEDAAFANQELLTIGRAHWVGKPWGQTVTEESKNKVNALLRDMGSDKSTKWRQLNQSAENGTDLPLSYSVITVPSGKTDGRIRALAFGRDLRPQAALQQKVLNAQRAMERDYWHLKNVETRYRLLFQVSSEAMLILNADTEKLEDSNPAAFELLGGDLHKSGWSIASSLDKASSTALNKAFAELLASGQSNPVALTLPQGGIKVLAHVSLFRQEKSAHFLIRLVSQSKRRPACVCQQPNTAAVVRGYGERTRCLGCHRPERHRAFSQSLLLAIGPSQQRSTRSRRTPRQMAGSGWRGHEGLCCPI